MKYQIPWSEVTATLAKYHGTLADAGRAIGVAPSHMRQMRRGMIRNPNFATGMALLDELRAVDGKLFESLWGELR